MKNQGTPRCYRAIFGTHEMAVPQASGLSRGQVAVRITPLPLADGPAGHSLPFFPAAGGKAPGAGFSAGLPARILIGSSRGIEHLIQMPVAVLARSDEIDAVTRSLLLRAISDAESRAGGRKGGCDGSMAGCIAELERAIIMRGLDSLKELKGAIDGYPDTYFSRVVLLSTEHPVSGVSLTMDIAAHGGSVRAAVSSFELCDVWYSAGKYPSINLGNRALISLGG